MGILDDVVARCSGVVPLATGGQKTVYSGAHPEFGPVVIKHGEYRYMTSLERVTREVSLLREIDSSYFPRQYEFIVDPIAREFLVVEQLLDAVELSDATSRFSSDAAILALLRHLCCALQLIWRRNVVHRDLKPANILITPDDQPRIIDLGIARFLDEASLTKSIAMQGPGTPIYAAPEQLTNRKAMINHRTDFFLLGLLALELVHGFHPFDPCHVGDDCSLVENILRGRYVPPPEDRSQVLTDFIKRTLDPRPYNRIRTVEALVRHLQMEDAC